MTGTPGRNNKHGTTPRAQGARRDPTSARSNMTASGPEQDLIAGTSCRAPPETGVKSTTATTVGTCQPREEPPPLPAPAAADQAETTPTTTENREREHLAANPGECAETGGEPETAAS